MPTKTSIEWTDYSANPLRFRMADGRTVWACEKVSAGCANCYADALSRRYTQRRAGDWNAGTMAGLTPYLDEKELRALLTSKAISGKRVFLCDMTDLFGEWVPDELIDRLLAVVALRPDVTFQVLSKRSRRMSAYLSGCYDQRRTDSGDGEVWRVGNRLCWTSLAPYEAEWEQVGGRLSGYALSEGESRVVYPAGLSPFERYVQWSQGAGVGASCGVASLRGTDCGWHDDQPQERSQVRQQDREPRTSNNVRAAEARDRSAERQKEQAQRITPSENQTDRERRSVDASHEVGRPHGETDCGEVRHEATGCIGYLQRTDLVARQVIPLPNLWLGVSAENQQMADERIPDLLQTPAAVRLVSAEPLIGPVDLTKIPIPNSGNEEEYDPVVTMNVLSRASVFAPHVHWVICGGESSRNARPMHPEWAESLRGQCKAAGVPFFFKQWGEWSPFIERTSGRADRAIWFDNKWDFDSINLASDADWPDEIDYGPCLYRVGKKAAGCLLDGEVFRQFPETQR